MKYTVKITVIAAMAIFAMSCSQWTDTESKYEPETVALSYGINDEIYYENLRAYKATMFDRKLSWGWFGGWTGTGSNMLASLCGLPDSLDIAALWNDWDITPAREADLKRVQKIKGTKVVVTQLISDFGWRWYAPPKYADTDKYTDADVLDYWGWEGDLDPRGPTMAMVRGRLYTVKCTPVQEAAIRKYARAQAQMILERGYDGYDIDYEIGWGSEGNLVEYYDRLRIYVDELSKYMGPKSGTDKLLIIDGAICNVPDTLGPCFNLFVIQAYNSSGYSDLNTGQNRLSQAVNRLKTYMPVDEIIKKIVMTEDYEQGRSVNGGNTVHKLENGGTTNSLMGLAVWQPTYDNVKYERHGGFGAYHIEYEYNAVGRIPGFYPWIREAIQAVNPAQK